MNWREQVKNWKPGEELRVSIQSIDKNINGNIVRDQSEIMEFFLAVMDKKFLEVYLEAIIKGYDKIFTIIFEKIKYLEQKLSENNPTVSNDYEELKKEIIQLQKTILPEKWKEYDSIAVTINQNIEK